VRKKKRTNEKNRKRNKWKETKKNGASHAKRDQEKKKQTRESSQTSGLKKKELVRYPWGSTLGCSNKQTQKGQTSSKAPAKQVEPSVYSGSAAYGHLKEGRAGKGDWGRGGQKLLQRPEADRQLYHPRS